MYDPRVVDQLNSNIGKKGDKYGGWIFRRCNEYRPSAESRPAMKGCAATYLSSTLLRNSGNIQCPAYSVSLWNQLVNKLFFKCTTLY